MKAKIFALLLCLLPLCSLAQGFGTHYGARNEIALTPGAACLTDSGEWGFSFSLRCSYRPGVASRWSIGVGIENIIAKDSHYGVTAAVGFEPFDGFIITAMPGLSFVSNDDTGSYDAAFSAHLEVVYECLRFNGFHLGPTIEYSYSNKDPHFVLGVRLSYAF